MPAQTTGPAPLRTSPTRAMSQSGPSVGLASFGLTTCLPEDQGVPAPHDSSRPGSVQRKALAAERDCPDPGRVPPSCSKTTVLQNCPGIDPWGTGYQS